MRRNVPLVEQVVLEIIARIDSGNLARVDGLIPSEADLSQRFGVSRATVREALGKLETAGVIIRRQGVGTFVNQFLSGHPTLMQDWFEEAHGFVDAIRSSGQEATARLISSRVEPAAEKSAFLQISPDAPVVVVEKVIEASGIPLIHSVNTVPVALLRPSDRLRAAELAAGCDSTFRFLEDFCSVRVHHQQSEIRATLTGDRIASLLGCRPECASLYVEEIAYGQDLVPLFHGLNYFRGDMVSLRQIRRPTFTISQAAAA